MLRDLMLRVLPRDMRAVADQIDAYPDDDALWRLAPGISNSGGTLALHLAGNLRHFVGATLGGSGYTRDRDAEFASRGLPRAEVSAMLREGAEEVIRALRGLDDAAFDGAYPTPVGPGVTLPMHTFLVHIAMHLTYHLGQIDYHRRIVGGGEALPGMLSMGALVAPLPEQA